MIPTNNFKHTQTRITRVTDETTPMTTHLRSLHPSLIFTTCHSCMNPTFSRTSTPNVPEQYDYAVQLFYSVNHPTEPFTSTLSTDFVTRALQCGVVPFFALHWISNDRLLLSNRLRVTEFATLNVRLLRVWWKCKLKHYFQKRQLELKRFVTDLCFAYGSDTAVCSHCNWVMPMYDMYDTLLCELCYDATSTTTHLERIGDTRYISYTRNTSPKLDNE